MWLANFPLQIHGWATVPKSTELVFWSIWSPSSSDQLFGKLKGSCWLKSGWFHGFTNVECHTYSHTTFTCSKCSTTYIKDQTSPLPLANRFIKPISPQSSSLFSIYQSQFLNFPQNKALLRIQLIRTYLSSYFTASASNHEFYLMIKFWSRL